MVIVDKENLADAVKEVLASINADKVFVLTDSNSSRACMPVVAEALAKAVEINIPAGDVNKNLESVSRVWEALQMMGATRKSLLVNLGGGMVTDLGGFAASCFKRGIKFVNIPTTLLAMVDASVGGKTGINFGMLKNEIGVFRDAEEVIISDAFLATLDNRNILSGCAEMMKHSLLRTESSRWNMENISDGEIPTLQEIADSIEVKRRIVEEDPHEKGLRKALNLGHTIGHAVETYCMKHPTVDSQQPVPILHGYAVAWGLVAELYLAVVKLNFPVERLRVVSSTVRENYGDCPITCKDYPELLQLMQHDKKNTAGKGVNFTLLDKDGRICIDQTASEEEIKEALDFLREG